MCIKFMVEITWANEDQKEFKSRHIINTDSGRDAIQRASEFRIMERDELDLVKVEILDHADARDVTDADMWAEWPDYEWVD